MSSQLPPIRLFCYVLGTQDIFSVKVSSGVTIDELKKAIIAEKPNGFQGIDADSLVLWKMVVRPKEAKNLKDSDLDGDNALDETWKVLDYFGQDPAEKCIHIVVRTPAPPPPPTAVETTNTDDTVLRQEVKDLRRVVDRLRYTSTTNLEIGGRVIEDSHVTSFDKLLPISAIPILSELDLNDQILSKESSNEVQTQEKFNTFFRKLPTGRRSIFDTSTSGFFNEPTAKIDISVIDGSLVTWPHLIIPIELKNDLKKHYREALGQLSDRFSEIMMQQPERRFIIGAVASDSEVELVSMNREWNFMHTGRLSLNLTDKNCPGLDLLVRIVTSSFDHNGYCPPDDISRLIISAEINFQFKTLIRKRRSDRGSFVAFGTTNNQNAVLKVSNTDKEHLILKKLSGLGVKNIPVVLANGDFHDRKYIIIQPFGNTPSLSKHGLKSIMSVFYDITCTIHKATALGVYHRDIKPENLIVYDSRGYTIDWGIATSDLAQDDEISATLAFTSLRILQKVRRTSTPILSYMTMTPYSVRDELESVFYSLIYVLCDGKIIWRTKGTPTELFDSRNAVMGPRFDEQLLKAPVNCRPILEELHNILFKRAEEPGINEIKDFFLEQSKM